MKRHQESIIMPILSAGRHRNPRHGACFMEFASYLAGERWSDHPACTHPLLAALARDVNDLTTDAARDRLMPHVHRVIGLNSDNPVMEITIAVRAAARALPVASLERQRALAAGLLTLLAAAGTPELERIAREAFDEAPDTERWAHKYLEGARLPRRVGERAAEAIVHTSVVGIALACIPDADDRLRELLHDVIDDAEALIGRATEEVPLGAYSGVMSSMR